MLIDDLQEQLKKLEPDIATIKTFWANADFETNYQKLNTESQAEDFWKNPNQIEIAKELQAIKLQREMYQTITQGFVDTQEMLSLFAEDEAELQKLAQELRKFAGQVKTFKIQLLLNEPDDKSNCFISVNSGAGGTESQDWAEMLCRMYIRFCEREGFNASIIDYQVGEEAGMKSATLFVKGKNAFGFLKSEHGIHRLVRISPYDSNKRRHTSFAGVHVVPETPDVEVTIDPNDLRIDTYRAGGAGGQHVNKTDSAVRITHLPTKLVTQCQSERSQLQNKETAMKMLKAKLAQKAKEKQLAKMSGIEKKKIEWGSQIRSYVLHPYKMVKDHRTDFESPQPDLVLDGDLIEFIENYLVKV